MSDSSTNHSSGARLGRLLTIPVVLSVVLLFALFTSGEKEKTETPAPSPKIVRENTSLYATAAYIGSAVIQVYPGEWSDRFERGANNFLSFETLNGVCIALLLDDGKIMVPKCGTGHEPDPELVPQGAVMLQTSVVPYSSPKWVRFMAVEKETARIDITRTPKTG